MTLIERAQGMCQEAKDLVKQNPEHWACNVLTLKVKEVYLSIEKEKFVFIVEGIADLERLIEEMRK